MIILFGSHSSLKSGTEHGLSTTNASQMPYTKSNGGSQISMSNMTDPHDRDKYRFKVHQHYCLCMCETDGCFVCCSMLYQTGVQDEVRSRYDICMIIGYMHEKRCMSQMCIRHTKSRALTNSPSI